MSSLHELNQARDQVINPTINDQLSHPLICIETRQPRTASFQKSNNSNSYTIEALMTLQREQGCSVIV